MSGIAGIFKKPGGMVTDEELDRMAEAISHRGPDGRSSYIDGAIGLSHGLLKIPSAVSVQQPLANEDGSLRIVCDGRVYNHEELRRRLEAKGHRFLTPSDIEVLLHLYEEVGERFLDDVRGMYGLALWDSRKQKLLLARDRIGVKPLYYAMVDGNLLFGSEIKAILADPQVKRGVNFRGMSDFFGISYIFDGETMFEDIMALPPSYIYTISADKAPRLQRYWDMKFVADHPWNEQEVAGQGLDILRESVELEIAGVSPLGIHLSGGIDSSFITSLAAEKDREPLITLSAGFREGEYDERGYAVQAAAKAGVPHEMIEVFPDADTFMDTMLKVIWHVDEPTVSPGIHSYYILNEFTARFVKVVLGGQGSNELLGGYNRYILADIREKFADSLKHLNPAGVYRQVRNTIDFYGPRPLSSLLLEMGKTPASRALPVVSTFEPGEKASLLSGQVKSALGGYSTEDRYMQGFNSAPAVTTIDRMMYLDLRGMMPNMLRVLDRTCAAFGVEARTPYLDHHFVDFSAGLSDDAVLRGTETKYILKKMGEGILRSDTIYRDKSGFAAPVTPWLQGHLRRVAREIILSDRVRERGYFDDAHLQKVVNRHESTGKGVWQVWMLLIFELWHRRFIDGEM